MTESKLIDKVRKLLRLAESSNEHEAAAAAAVISQLPMLDELQNRHRALVEKSVGEGIALDPHEQAELRRIRWQLDRIDDAVEGDHIDMLEIAVAQHRALAEEVSRATASIAAMHSVIRADEVRPGHYIYDTGTRRWVRVRSVGMVQGYTVLKTIAWDTWKHPGEAVAVRCPLNATF